MLKYNQSRSNSTISWYYFKGWLHNVSKGGGSRYLLAIDLEKTNINIENIKTNIKNDRENDKIYDRQNNACGHHVEKVFAGENIGGKSLETQKSFMNTVEKITKDVDSTFFENFLDIAVQSGVTQKGR
ncbi:MAG: hypothetical protein LEGION0398_MBIBDBAK_01447 [Legionellaceae bacterium]